VAQVGNLCEVAKPLSAEVDGVAACGG